jgi:hypothetical protein
MKLKRHKALDEMRCPGCSAVGTLRTILYGMPDPETFDFEMYAVGGCCMNGQGIDPEVKCRVCEWEGMRQSN